MIKLSHPLTSATPSYGNRDIIKILEKSSIDNGDSANTSSWYFSNNHIGTHIDTPYHFDINGKKTIEYADNEWIFFNPVLLDIPCCEAKLIAPDDLCEFEVKKNCEILLIRTGYEKFRNEDKYHNDNPGLHPESADYLREKYPLLRCVGFDFISLTSWKFRTEGRLGHKNFLAPREGKRPILIIEDMSLDKITSLLEWILVAPLFCSDGNGGLSTIFGKLENENK